jgi:predicted CoA-substrate-specific enzyme activase
LRLGIDIGSTTVKVFLYDTESKCVYKNYRRHNADINVVIVEMLNELKKYIKQDSLLKVAVTGSAGMGKAKTWSLPFVQEVYATQIAIKEYASEADVAVELGGEDAKIIFLSNGLEYRMNGSCAGGTGAFIDQMATLLNVSLDELNELSLGHDTIYTIASRCGVFAKSDIQPLLNQGAKKENIAASIYQAVVGQTVAGLAQGREIKGKVVFLGGPLTFSTGLRKRFVESLNLTKEQAIFPNDSEYFVCMGAALYSDQESLISYKELMHLIESKSKADKNITNILEPLFNNAEEYKKFVKRHSPDDVKYLEIKEYTGEAYLGIDAGSTTTKIILISKDGDILYSYYSNNHGNPVQVIKKQLLKVYDLIGDRIKIRSGCVVGYGEDIIKTAFGIDFGLVETVAHYLAAHHFNEKVDFIIDIGGQDIKCFHVKNNAIDNIMLNEACSSGCGSFIETYAKALGYSVADFADLALFAKHPMDLGSRCTVFMNSSIKQAQKDGAGVDDISAGLSLSVVKNAIYKVMRANSADDLGDNIVVQGGTFFNDAILRSFERELGRNVTRPSIAGLMGAYGAALYSIEMAEEDSKLISKEELETFKHKSNNAICKLCTNHCSLTINIFNGKQKYISGNRCDRPYTGKAENDTPNIFKEKFNYLLSIKGKEGARGKIGMPMGLNMYENLPFWNAFFSELNIELVTSGMSSYDLYVKGHHTIPSDTVCYPAKLMHGHIEQLLEMGIKDIFYPCMSYNFDEKLGDNNYNCPVVAYYPELLDANMSKLKEINYYRPHFGIHRKNDFKKKAYEFFSSLYDLSFKEISSAVKKAYEAHYEFKKYIIKKGHEAIKYARKNNMKIIVMAGRPYHVDPEINHGLDSLITSYNMVLLTEDCVSHVLPKPKVKVLNQWTYQSRMYSAANYVMTQPDMEFIQLVSFGCGTDAVTTDEIREMLEEKGELYTQLKIDEITNLGAAKIRIRSLIAAISAKERQHNEN